MRRHRPRLDLLPLLDVFIVVLFVFATVHERKIDESVQARHELAARVAELEAALTEARSVPDVVMPPEVQTPQTPARPTEPPLDDAHRERSETALGADLARRLDVFEKLLDHFSVFEIEIVGLGDAPFEVTNTCCYRVDMQSPWRACGSVPADPAQRRAWLEHGAGGLVEALRRTKGGNALTIVRQDPVATHRIGSKLGDLLREHLPAHEIYAGGIAPAEASCTASAAEDP